MKLRDAELMRSGEVMQFLGIGKKKLRAMIEVGLVQPMYVLRDKRGRPKGRALYAKTEILSLAGRV